MWMGIAQTASMRSTCFRGNVGAVIVYGTDIISLGYNGPESGKPHCIGANCPLTDAGSCKNSIHAEKNAILRCDPADVIEADLYCTHSPCRGCSELIIESKIARVFYQQFYKDKRPIVNMLKNGVLVYRITPSGYIIDERTNELVI
jgi:dCMP deaminase